MKSLPELEVQIEQVAHILKLLAHPKRLLILCRLSLWAKTVGDLERECEISQSQLSQFLSKMKEEQLLTSEKKWLFVMYQIANPQVKEILESLSSIYCKP